MPVTLYGQMNLNDTSVPNLIVQILSAQVSNLNGVPTDIVGVVGGATWGPTNAPTIVGDLSEYTQQFGDIQSRTFDAGTVVYTATQQGAKNFRIVRVTDDTDTAANASVASGVLTLTAMYTGTGGNSIVVSQAAGSAAGSVKVTVSKPGVYPEVFDNIMPVGGKISVGIAQALNQGVGALRGPSQLVVAAAGGSEASNFSIGTVTLAGGTDGWPTLAAQLVGDELTTQRKGMYALRNSKASIIVLADVTDLSTATTQAAFGLSEGAYMVGATAAGDTIEAAVAAKAAAGIDSAWFKLMFGDWVYITDPLTKLVRLVSPQGFIAGLMANLSPEQSPLNKPMYSIVGTQRTMSKLVYSDADLAALSQAGIDVITNPVPGGNYFGARIGRNTSSDATVRGDNYTRLTNYLAFTIYRGIGKFIGLLQTVNVRANAKGTLTNFLSNMEFLEMIGDVNGGPAFSVRLDASNNPDARVAQGFMQADVQVKYLSVIETFLVNLQGGQAVSVTRVSTQPNA